MAIPKTGHLHVVPPASSPFDSKAPVEPKKGVAEKGNSGFSDALQKLRSVEKSKTGGEKPSPEEVARLLEEALRPFDKEIYGRFAKDIAKAGDAITRHALDKFKKP